MNALTNSIPDDIRTRYEEVDGLSEPIIDRQHRTNSSVHNTFRDMAPLPEFTSVPLLQDAGPVTALPQRVFCPTEDNRPLLLLAHIPRNHDAETLFNKDFVVLTKNLEWLRGTYVGMSEHGLVRPCRG